MKTIPVLREKKRYIAFEINSEKTIIRQELVREILNSIISLFGDKGASQINRRLCLLRKVRDPSLRAGKNNGNKGWPCLHK